MDVDEKEFFREATLRICGSLEIEKALWKCFMYVREFIPAQQAFLTYHDPNLGVVKVLAPRRQLLFPLDDNYYSTSG